MRIVRDLNPQSTTTAQRTPVDSYARPFYHDDQRLNSISVALRNFFPVYKQHDEAERKKKEAYLEAVGMKLSESLDNKETLESIKQRAAKGDLSGYREIPVVMQNGIVKARTLAFVNTLAPTMEYWGQSATYTDERTGLQKPLSQCDDPTVFTKEFNKQFSSMLQTATGGQIDPELYQEYVMPKRASVLQSIQAKHIQMRAEALRQDQQQAIGYAIGSYIDTYAANNKFNSDYNTSVAGLRDQINASVVFMMQNGMNQDDAYKGAVYAVRDRLENIESISGTEARGIYEAAMSSVFKDRTDLTREVSLSFNNSMRNRRYNENDARFQGIQAREQAARQSVFKAYQEYEKQKGGIANVDPGEFLRSYKPKNAEEASVLFSFTSRAASASETARNAGFEDLKKRAYQGELSASEFEEIRGNLSYERQKELTSILYNRYQNPALGKVQEGRESIVSAVDKLLKSDLGASFSDDTSRAVMANEFVDGAFDQLSRMPESMGKKSYQLKSDLWKIIYSDISNNKQIMSIIDQSANGGNMEQRKETGMKNTDTQFKTLAKDPVVAETLGYLNDASKGEDIAFYTPDRDTLEKANARLEEAGSSYTAEMLLGLLRNQNAFKVAEQQKQQKTASTTKTKSKGKEDKAKNGNNSRTTK